MRYYLRYGLIFWKKHISILQKDFLLQITKRTQIWLCFLFFLSGFPALIYQIVWQRSLFVIYGTNIQSITIVVANFLFGLGVGALLGGWISTYQSINLLRLFGLLESSIGIIGLFSLKILFAIGKQTINLPLSSVSIVVFLLLLLPTIMMGASLPILVAYLTKRLSNISQSVSSLYSANTFGAAFACFCVAIFMQYLGQASTVTIAAIFNLSIGITALLLSWFNYSDQTNDISFTQLSQTNIVEPHTAKLKIFLMLLLSALTGYLALSYEIIWMDVYSFISRGTAVDFAIFLCYYLGGIGFGSYICSKFSDSRLLVDFKVLFWLLVANTSTCYFVLPLIAILMKHSNNIQNPLIIINITTLLFGVTFPLICNFFISLNNRIGPMMGCIYFANILGSTISVLLTGFVLMNTLSIPEIANYLFIVGVVAALVPLIISPSVTRKALIAYCGFLFCFTIIIFLGSNSFFHCFYEKLLFKTSYTQGPVLKYVVENNVGVITVTQKDEVFGSGVYDGYFNIDPKHNLNSIWRAYAIPLFSQKPQNVLMIGLSSGSWAQVIANNPDVKYLTIIEINPGYLKLINKYNDIASLFNNPKVSIVIDDGRRWLARNKKQKYDLIVMNTTFYWRSYTPFLLSKDFFQLIQQHLANTGIFYFNTTFSLDAIKTAMDAFPYVNSLGNFAIASNKPLQFDLENLKRHLLNYTINGKKVLDLNNVLDKTIFEEIMAIPRQNIVDQQTLEKMTQGAKIITDDTFLLK